MNRPKVDSEPEKPIRKHIKPCRAARSKAKEEARKWVQSVLEKARKNPLGSYWPD